MSIDIILWSADKATLRTFGIDNGLLVPVDDEEGGTRYVNRDGFDWSWWAGDGQLMTANGTYDGDGVELTPPTYLAGVVALMRISQGFFESDRLIPDELDPDKEEQWARSKIARYIKNNGTPGTVAGGSITYYEVDDVRLFRPVDVEAWLVSKGLDGHEIFGGNTY